MDHFRPDRVRSLEAETDAVSDEELSQLRRVLFQEPPTTLEILHREYRELIERAQKRVAKFDPVHAFGS